MQLLSDLAKQLYQQFKLLISSTKTVASWSALEMRDIKDASKGFRKLENLQEEIQVNAIEVYECSNRLTEARDRKAERVKELKAKYKGTEFIYGGQRVAPGNPLWLKALEQTEMHRSEFRSMNRTIATLEHDCQNTRQELGKKEAELKSKLASNVNHISNLLKVCSQIRNNALLIHKTMQDLEKTRADLFGTSGWKSKIDFSKLGDAVAAIELHNDELERKILVLEQHMDTDPAKAEEALQEIKHHPFDEFAGFLSGPELHDLEAKTDELKKEIHNAAKSRKIVKYPVTNRFIRPDNGVTYILFGTSRVKELLETNILVRDLVLKKLPNLINFGEHIIGGGASTDVWRSVAPQVIRGEISGNNFRIFYYIDGHKIKIGDVTTHGADYAQVSSLVSSGKYRGTQLADKPLEIVPS